jgi:starch synthase (maltosyl-transferring)
LESIAQREQAVPRTPWPREPVSLALVITDLDVGGAERALVALALGLDRRRWSPTVFCLSAEGPLVEPLAAAGIVTECLDARRTRPVAGVRRLAVALRRSQPRLVQSFLFHANVATRLAAPWAGHPWVLGGLRVAERGKRWHLWLDRLTCRLSVGSVCVSRGVQRFSRDVARLPADRLTLIPNGIDPARFDNVAAARPDELGIPPGAPWSLFVGRLEPQKGLPTLLDAALLVRRQLPEWHLVVVGDGPDRGALEERSRALPGLAAHVHWIGRRNDVAALLQAAGLLVLPSLWEGMPNVVLEAMAARRAVVATRVEGTEDLVVPGETGWLVPTSDAPALSCALIEAHSQPAERIRRGAAGRRRVESEFSQQAVVRAYERLWAAVLGYRAEDIDSHGSASRSLDQE